MHCKMEKKPFYYGCGSIQKKPQAINWNRIVLFLSKPLDRIQIHFICVSFCFLLIRAVNKSHYIWQHECGKRDTFQSQPLSLNYRSSSQHAFHLRKLSSPCLDKHTERCRDLDPFPTFTPSLKL